ncbi:MAG TPA: cob(I)yrinic acid a,c-diamide adenosyltransferase [Bacteroidetes bacterium]|nr:cob(I)yrinic acid a,c-diamide adenosyltransferase [Bacteroidota bacterium]
MAFKIYTKTGDAGQTALFGGRRVPKSDLRIDAYGTVDELNSYMGMLRDVVPESEFRHWLKEIQDRLFTIGSGLATDPAKNIDLPGITREDVRVLESHIDKMEERLPPLKNFILPGGHPTVSFCHIARTVCRRTERLVVALHLVEPVEPLVLQYFNRLSDFLFVLGRVLGKQLGAEEVVWKPGK